jgi:uncharacterized protein (DUF58 family)
LKPNSLKTSLDKGLSYLLGLVKRRSLIFLISDFVDEGYEHHLKALARKHDLIVIHLKDKLETDLPKLGIVPIKDKETGKTQWVNTSSAAFKKNFQEKNQDHSSELRDICNRNQADYLLIDTQEDFLPKLIKLFKIRNLSKKKA